MTHTNVWTRCWSLVGVLGFALALLIWGPADVLGLWAGASIVAGFLLIAVSSLAEVVAAAAGRSWRRVVGRSVLIGVGVVSVIAVVAAAPLPGLTLIAVAAASSPWAQNWFRTWSGHHTAHPPRAVENELQKAFHQDAPAPTPNPLSYSQSSVRELSDGELCHEWRRSFLVLKAAYSQGEFSRVVAVRQLLLDEIERRSPAALNAWLISGARAAGGPDRFLRKDRPDGRRV